MDEQPTCGKGLAEHSALPAKLGELAAAMAETLEVHQQALDVTDENARKEHHAYVKLAQEFRCVAAHLQVTAEHMAGYRDLPMGRHDQRAMAAPAGAQAFTKFVRIEKDLLEMLRAAVERDQKMLAAMRGLEG
jgi:hypothetical protein